MSQIKSFEMEDVAYKEWSEHLDLVTPSRGGPWLPAYGYLQQSPFQDFFSRDDPYNSDGGSQQFFLETIVEESSDDLCSESDKSGPSGWNSDSDADSVIHIPKTPETYDRRSYDSDASLPKRLRLLRGVENPSSDDEDPPDPGETASSSSRSSSLLAFESLEKHCEDVFKTSASSDPFGWRSGDTTGWRFTPGCPTDPLPDSETSSSSDDTLHLSLSSHSSFRSSLTNDSRLRAYRSFDSLNLLDSGASLSCSAVDLSQSHNALDFEKERDKEQEEYIVRDKKLTATTANLSIMTDSFQDELYTLKNIRKRTAEIASFHSIAVHRERLSLIVRKESFNGRKAISVDELKDQTGELREHRKSEPCLSIGKSQQSAENLSEDSGFGESRCLQVHTTTPESSSDSGCEDSLNTLVKIAEMEREVRGSVQVENDDETNFRANSPRGLECWPASEESAVYFARPNDGSHSFIDALASTPPLNDLCTRSTPQFSTFCKSETVGSEKSSSCVQDNNSALGTLSATGDIDTCVRETRQFSTFGKSDSLSVKNSFQEVDQKPWTDGAKLSVFRGGWDADMNGIDGGSRMASRLPAVSAPNLYLGDDVSLTEVPLKAAADDEPKGKGVHFCPIVSEVSWRESYSESSIDSSSDASTDEMSNRSLEELCMGNGEEEENELEEKVLPPRTAPNIQRIQIGVPDCDGTGRQRVSVDWSEGAVYDHSGSQVVNGIVPNVETQLVPPTLEVTPVVLDHVVASDAEIPNAGRISTSLSVGDVCFVKEDALSRSVSADSDSTNMDNKGVGGSNGKSKFGGFFERFSFRRLSSRMTGKKSKKKAALQSSEKEVGKNVSTGTSAEYEDVTIIPLHAPDVVVVAAPSGRGGKPPLPPRMSTGARRTTPDVTTGTVSSGLRDASTMPGVRGPTAIDTAEGPGERDVPRPLETDLDALDPPERREGGKKARSLMNLGLGEVTAPRPNQLTSVKPPSDDRARSMEFLLDKENQAAIMAPENELQKSGPTMSEHQLRVQRSLQKLNVPEWYKNSSVAHAPSGFLLKRTESSQGWPGLGSKTTSLSSLGSVQSTRSPTSHMVSPTPPLFTRWSTSRLNSAATSSSTSPCGSARASFHYRQPYLGWRSQERLTKRTPAERLAAGFLPQRHYNQQAAFQNQQQQQTPSLTEVRTSIKEVTSAIVHYVAGTSEGNREPPRSPRGSTGRLCWVESSFVGSRPMDQPETPMQADQLHGDRPELYLELPRENIPRCEVSAGESRKASIGSTTLDEILDSLLGLPPGSRSPSPRLPPGAQRPSRDLVDGSGSASIGAASLQSLQDAAGGGGRRSSDARPTNEEPMVRCRYSKCGRTATVAEAKRTFKTCHNCAHVYCSRECRRAHWERHRRTCLHSRVGALCRQVLAAAKEDEATRSHLSLLARRGYLTHGRGAVKCFFSCPEAAERFVARGLPELGEPAYVRWPDLMPAEMGTDLYAELMKLCKGYNPESRLVLYVAVCVLSEVPTTGAVKWERQLVSRCCKVRLEKSLLPQPPPLPPRRSSSDGVDITREMADPDTLILTSLPGTGDMPISRAREVCLTNIQRELRQRGVSLRRQFPDVYKKLVAYAESTTERFPPTTIYPRDGASRTFMCIIMPDADPEKLELVPRDNGRVTTVDVGVPPAS